MNDVPNQSKKDPLDEIEPIDVTCELKTFSTVYRIKLNRYSQIMLCPDNFMIDCGTFDLAGHHWAVTYKATVNFSPEIVRIYIRLLSETTTSMYQTVQLNLIDPSGNPPVVFENSVFAYQKTVDEYYTQFILDSSKYVKDDCLLVACTVTVTKWCPVRVVKQNPQLDIPHSNIQEDLGQLLESGKGADVSFEVCNDGFSEIIVAHTIVLAARSPVFRALLSGLTTDGNRDCIRIDDMEAAVFKAILYYVYTDKLPQELELSPEMARQLFVAADRYKLERVKLICAQKLCDLLDFKTATSTLVLAEQYDCEPLKNACLKFVSTAHKNEQRY